MLDPRLAFLGRDERHELLALQKVGAYVEYLDQRGLLAITNIGEVAADEGAAPRYRQA